MAADENYDAEAALAEVAKIINRTGQEVEVETLMRGLTYLAVPVVALYKYLTDSDISQETAEDMIVWVWRSWFEQQHRGPDFYGEPEGDD